MSTTKALSADAFTAGDGTRLRVLESDPADAPSALVLVHGWTLTQHTWDGVVAALPVSAETPVWVVRFDLRGHGESDPAPRALRRSSDALTTWPN